MSTTMKTEMKRHSAIRFWGGDKHGVCLQIQPLDAMTLHSTAIDQVQEEGFINVDFEEAAALANALAQFVKKEASRRQGLLRDQLRQMQIDDRNIFAEVCRLPDVAVESLTVGMISRFCPVAGDVGMNASAAPSAIEDAEVAHG